VLSSKLTTRLKTPVFGFTDRPSECSEMRACVCRVSVATSKPGGSRWQVEGGKGCDVRSIRLSVQASLTEWSGCWYILLC
jgi:hypothetical protein